MTLDELNAKYGKPITTNQNSNNPFGFRQPNQKEQTKSFAEKIASFTGGEKIGQGLGQALANPEIAKQHEQALNDAITQQSELLKRKKEIQDLGGDTSHIDKGLEYNKQNLEQLGNGLQDLMNQKGLTTKQVIGDALQLGTTVLGAGQIPGVAKTATSATGIVAGAKQGAVQGIKAGAIYGASSGASDALKEDKSAIDIAKGTIGGALVGAGTGGLVGGLVGGVSGGIKQQIEKKASKEYNHALDLVSPEQTAAIKEQALKEGRVTEQGLLNASKITPSKRDIQLADAIDGVVSSKNSPTKNLNLIDNKVKDINTGVKAYVKANKVPFNTNQLSKQLDNGKSELDLIFASDKNAEKTYNAVKNKFMELVKNKDTAGLLDARQEFDKIPAVKKLLDSDKLGENARKEIVTTIRTQANKYVADLLPVGNEYRSTLLKESKMIEAIQNIAEKNKSTIGTNKIQQYAKKYPWLNWAVGGAAAGLIGGGSIAVGRSVIGSSD